jgi:hypothetical protein
MVTWDDDYERRREEDKERERRRIQAALSPMKFSLVILGEFSHGGELILEDANRGRLSIPLTAAKWSFLAILIHLLYSQETDYPNTKYASNEELHRLLREMAGRNYQRAFSLRTVVHRLRKDLQKMLEPWTSDACELDADELAKCLVECRRNRGYRIGLPKNRVSLYFAD